MTIVVELLAIVALLCAAVVAVTTWHLPRAFTVAMVLGPLSGAVPLGCIAVPSPTQKWQSGAWRRCVVGHPVAVVVCGVALLCTGIDAADEGTRRERSVGGTAGDLGAGCVGGGSCGGDRALHRALPTSDSM